MLKTRVAVALVFSSSLYAAVPGAWGAAAPDEPPTVQDILRSAKEVSMAINDPTVDKEEITRRIAEAQAKAGDIKGALSTVLSNPQYHSILLSQVAAAQASAGDLKTAYKTLEKIKEPADRVHALIGIANAHVKTGEAKKAAAVFEDAAREAEEAATKKKKTELLAEIARAQSKAGDWLSAYTTVDAMPDPSEKSRLMAKLAKSEARQGNIKGAMSIAEGITGDLSVKGQALSDIAVIRAGKGDLKGALETAKEIEDDYYRGTAFVGLSGFLFKEKRKTEAMSLLQQAKLIAKTMKGGSYDRSMLLKDIAVAQMAAGDPDGAKESFQDAEQAAHQIEKSVNYLEQLALLAVAESLSRAGHAEQAEQVIQQALHAVLSSENPVADKVQILTMIANSELEIGAVDRALPVLQRALELSRKIGNPTARSLAMIELSVGFGQADALNEALDVLHQARQASNSISEEAEQLAVQINITVTFLRLGRMKDAIRVADEAGNENRRSNVIGRIAETQAAEGDVEGAYELAMEQSTPLAKTRALIGVAEGMLKDPGAAAENG